MNERLTLTRPSYSRGFTLIELLVVVSIIGMMTAAIMVNTNAARSQSRDAKRQADANLVAGSLEVYYSEQRSYPLITTPTGSWDLLKKTLWPTYISSWPKDPSNKTDGYIYQTNLAIPATGSTPAVAAGLLFAVDVTLEEKNDTNVNNSIECNTPTNYNYYASGICKDSTGSYHYRVSSR